MTAILELSAALRDEMRGVSWHEHPSCPSFDDLRLVKVRHHGFDGATHEGELIVRATFAREILAVFEQLYAAGFPIYSVQRIDRFAGDDNASMAANNSSGFNFRVVDGTDQLSQHALGCAIDINPVQNPWVRGQRVDPEAGRAYLDRTQLRPGMIVRPGPVVSAFEAAGWRWGGDHPNAADFHHFSKP